MSSTLWIAINPSSTFAFKIQLRVSLLPHQCFLEGSIEAPHPIKLTSVKLTTPMKLIPREGGGEFVFQSSVRSLAPRYGSPMTYRRGCFLSHVASLLPRGSRPRPTLWQRGRLPLRLRRGAAVRGALPLGPRVREAPSTDGADGAAAQRWARHPLWHPLRRPKTPRCTASPRALERRPGLGSSTRWYCPPPTLPGAPASCVPRRHGDLLTAPLAASLAEKRSGNEPWPWRGVPRRGRPKGRRRRTLGRRLRRQGLRWSWGSGVGVGGGGGGSGGSGSGGSGVGGQG